MRKRPKHETTDSNFYQSRHIDKYMMRDDTFNLHLDPEITEMTSTQQIPISQVFLRTRANQKGSFRTKTYRKYVIRTRANQKDLSSIKVLRRRENQKAFKKVSTQTK